MVYDSKPKPPKNGPAKPQPAPDPDSERTAKLRVVSYLWSTTVPDNPFATDGPTPAVPQTWPGDDLHVCRQWHGLDLSAQFGRNGKVVRDSVRLREPSYCGFTESCGFIGKTTVTDRHVTEPRIGESSIGEYVEARTLLGNRLGAFVPDLAVDGTLSDFGLGEIDEIIEQISEEGYLGTNGMAPKIFTYAYVRLYARSSSAGWVSDRRASGFVDQKDIIAGQFGSSWIPEHHLYLDGKLRPSDSRVPTSPEHKQEIEAWLTSPSWYRLKAMDVYAFKALSASMIKWAEETPDKEKLKVAEDFKKRFPDYYIGHTISKW